MTSDASPIKFQRPTFPPGAQIGRYFDLSRQQRWFSNSGPCWRLLRDRLEDRVGRYCVPVASGTAGLMASITASLAAGGHSSSRMSALMPSFTFPATAQAAMLAGVEPILMDIDPRNWHLDGCALERVLGDTREDLGVVLAVSAFGTPPPAETRLRWEEACRSAGMPLVIDSAAGFGGIADDGTPIGAQGSLEVVSFHATKPFAIGEGGAVFTHSRELRDLVELAINFGFGASRSVAIAGGMNGKMSELHAATALAVLDEFDSILGARREAAANIRSSAGREIIWQAGCEHSTWQFVPVACRDSKHRDLIERSSHDRAEVRTYYEPLHEMTAFSKYPIIGDLQNTSELHARILCLPMANDLDREEQELIASVLRSAHALPRAGAGPVEA